MGEFGGSGPRNFAVPRKNCLRTNAPTSITPTKPGYRPANLDGCAAEDTLENVKLGYGCFGDASKRFLKFNEDT